jgi:hypothetical protein
MVAAAILYFSEAELLIPAGFASFGALLKTLFRRNDSWGII